MQYMKTSKQKFESQVRFFPHLHAAIEAGERLAPRQLVTIAQIKAIAILESNGQAFGQPCCRRDADQAQIAANLLLVSKAQIETWATVLTEKGIEPIRYQVVLDDLVWSASEAERFGHEGRAALLGGIQFGLFQMTARSIFGICPGRKMYAELVPIIASPAQQVALFIRKFDARLKAMRNDFPAAALEWRRMSLPEVSEDYRRQAQRTLNRLHSSGHDSNA